MTAQMKPGDMIHEPRRPYRQGRVYQVRGGWLYVRSPRGTELRIRIEDARKGNVTR